MQIIRKISDWSLITTCTGEGFNNRHKPCGYELIIEENDIVRLEYIENGTTQKVYGFICMCCHCFTKIDTTLIPLDIALKCPTILKTTTEAYSKLSVEEQVLSDKV